MIKVLLTEGASNCDSQAHVNLDSHVVQQHVEHWATVKAQTGLTQDHTQHSSPAEISDSANPSEEKEHKQERGVRTHVSPKWTEDFLITGRL